MRQPFFRAEKQCWYVKDDAGKFIRLHKDKDKAFEVWHEIKSERTYEGADATVTGLIEKFLFSIDGELSIDRFNTLAYYAELFRASHGRLSGTG